jgi:hypothetical protein
MSKFRMVVLDYAKEQLENKTAQKIMSDLVFTKQINFLRSEPNYVVTDKHDMIGTHYMMYDVTNLYEPKLIFAIRTTYLSRSTQHRIETPLLSLVPKLDLPLQKLFHDFERRHPELVDCNAWFVDPNYSKKNSGLNLSDLGYFMVCMNILREGYDCFIGCTNEKFNASRWLEQVGDMPKGHIFEHPAVKSPHMLILMENFNLDHFAKIYEENEQLIENLFEVFPATGKQHMKFSEFAKQVLGSRLKGGKVAVAA